MLNHCTALIDQDEVCDELKIICGQDDPETEIHQVPLVSSRDALLEHVPFYAGKNSAYPNLIFMAL